MNAAYEALRLKAEIKEAQDQIAIEQARAIRAALVEILGGAKKCASL
jgi:hypothetical protein